MPLRLKWVDGPCRRRTYAFTFTFLRYVYGGGYVRPGRAKGASLEGAVQALEPVEANAPL
jgi:hypothetical protein